MIRDLLTICALPPGRVADVIRTSDGHYLAREVGDCGFNAFLGAPNPRPRPETTARAWRAFRAGDRRAIVRLARARGVRLRDFLVKGGA